MQKILPLTLTVFCLLFLFYCCKKEEPSNGFKVTVLEAKKVEKSNAAKLYVHYMPWFETPATNNGQWGWHWTMGNKNPNNIINGQREIASWYYPLIEPYASSDPDVLEYHLLLMKYAGIDGVLVDWYGLQQKNDLPGIAKNTDALFKAIEKVGLEFGIVYEDRFLEGSKTAMIAQAKTDMKYLQDNYFKKSYYAARNGKPLLLIFGPATLQDKTDWENIFGVFAATPSFYTLIEHFHTANTTAAGEYMWVNAKTAEENYARAAAVPDFMGAVYPGFRDYYAQGGGGNHLFDIDHEDGKLFKKLLDLGKQKEMNCLQIVTWNDFGEGTMIEPTVEFGYKFLTYNQQFAGVSYSENELKAIKNLYDLRKNNAGKREKNKKLDQAFYYFVSLQPAQAEQMMNELE
ncbi:hypothetical protein FACS1894156_1380 [Bacteroidia bacterium]|nr:hypothetical protein FACS1894156_1380 [Bacteroidia bacterium]